MSPSKLDIEKLIEKLLHHYECVILPDFGGFIIRDSPCNFNVAKDKLKPYSKHIFFNPHLLENDGLLYKEIQKTQELSYQESIMSYQSWLTDIKQVIHDAGSKSFGNLGTFYKGNENNVWFSPVSTLNLSMDSYGLFPVEVKQVLTEEKTIETVFEKDKILHDESIPGLADNIPIESFEPKRLNYKAWLVAASLALIAHVTYLTFEKTDVTLNEASVLPLIDNQTNTDPSVKISDSTIMVENNNEVVTDETEFSEKGDLNENTVTTDKPVVESQDPEDPAENKSIENLNEIIQIEQAEFETIPQVEDDLMTRVAKYRFENNAIYHCNDLRKNGIVSEVRHNGEWYEVLTEGTKQ